MKIKSIVSPSESNSKIHFGKIGLVFGSLIAGQWFLTDMVHLPGGEIGILVTGFGIWWLSKPIIKGFKPPTSLKGWMKRCQEVLVQFERLDESDLSIINQNRRKSELDEIINKEDSQEIVFLCAEGTETPDEILVNQAISSAKDIDISWPSPLSIVDKSWTLPCDIYKKEAVVYILPLPLRAADLLWLEKVPEDQPAWVMISMANELDWDESLRSLSAQLPSRWLNRVLCWNKSDEDLSSLLNPVRRVLNNPQKNLETTRQRLLSRLHCSWQAELEALRREKFYSLQQKSQWLVAGAVFASPVPSTDLIALAVVNGLMVNEMASLWCCNWRPEVLHVVARQLALAAVAQGVIEWSGQALLGVAKLHGGGWIAAGSLQALSAAYLTRVVGRSMADWMALNNGVASPDLDLLKSKAPQIVANAAEEEKVDWSLFLSQARTWVSNGSISPAFN